MKAVVIVPKSEIVGLGEVLKHFRRVVTSDKKEGNILNVHTNGSRGWPFAVFDLSCDCVAVVGEEATVEGVRDVIRVLEGRVCEMLGVQEKEASDE